MAPSPSRRRALAPVDWSVWAAIQKAQLWQAVLLSLDVEPGHSSSAGSVAEAVASGRGQELFGAEFERRLFIAQQNVSTQGPLRPLKLYAGALKNPKVIISLGEFRAFAENQGWTLPERFPREPTQVQSTKSEDEKAGVERGSSARERDNMLRVILGLAIGGYRYDPDQKRNPAVADMLSDLAKAGVEISDDTLRKYLKEAAKLVSPGNPALKPFPN